MLVDPDDDEWFEVHIRIIGWEARIRDQWHRYVYRVEREASEWIDIGGSE